MTELPKKTRQSKLTNACKELMELWLEIARVEIGQKGEIVIDTVQPQAFQPSDNGITLPKGDGIDKWGAINAGRNDA